MKHFNHLLISTGTSTWNEIKNSVQDIDYHRYSLLHCVSSYPCNFDVVNLPRIDDLKVLSKSLEELIMLDPNQWHSIQPVWTSEY